MCGEKFTQAWDRDQTKAEQKAITKANRAGGFQSGRKKGVAGRISLDQTWAKKIKRKFQIKLI